MFALLLFSFVMSIMLWFFSYYVKFFRKHLKIYGTLFTVLTIGLIGFTFHQNKQIWMPKLEKIFAEERDIASHVAVPVATEGPTNLIDEQIMIKDEVRLKAPLIQQYPELPRGCEVTSLAMLLQYNGYEADKMTLAKEIKRDPSPYKVKDGKTYFGNPYDGFVGDMYSLTTPGLGVYHGPLVELANKYVDEDTVVDLTDQSFYEVLEALNKDQAVQVIINAAYEKLPDSAFQTWHTPSGPVKITMREHSVLITGYDKDYVYFNDPLNRQSKARFDDFVAAWEQMGKQAITIEKRKTMKEV